MTKFHESQFTPTQWTTQEDKAKFANDLIRFIQSDFKRTFFTKSLYKRLSSTFGFIAHYNLDGYYNTWFDGTFHQLTFLMRLRDTAIFGDPAFTYCDVEQVIQAWVQEQGLVDAYHQQYMNDVENRERAELARLLEKYGMD